MAVSGDLLETLGEIRSWLDGVIGERDPLVVALVSVVALSIGLRLAFLGARIAHWDEARVAYWVAHYADTGSFAYRRIIHGPLIQHVNRWLFLALGENDYIARLPVALVGGLLPLSAYLFREHLRRVEVVALAVVLAINPVLLYYSRFMRSDVLVAAFMFVAFGLLVRLYDTREPVYLYGVGLFVALGFASKENAIVYLLTWIGAAGLLADQALYRPRDQSSGFALLADRGRSLWKRYTGDRSTTRRLAAAYAGHAVGAVFVFFAVSVFLYAPRGAGMEGIYYPPATPAKGPVGFWQALGSPTRLPAMVEATVTRAVDQFTIWFSAASEPGCGEETVIGGYVCFLGKFVEVMITKAIPLTALAVFGFVWERYGATRSRNLVLFAAYGGFVSVLGYPLGTDVFGSWLLVHAIVPLAIPAAVGAGRVYSWGQDAFSADDAVGVVITAALLLAIVGQVGAVAATSVYTNDQARDNTMVQYAQPGGDFRPVVEDVRRIASDHEGTDVLLYYGEQGDDYDDRIASVEKDPGDWNASVYDLRPLCAKWYNTLPQPWYYAATDANVTCARNQSTLAARVGSDDPPPVVVTLREDTTVPRDQLSESYSSRTYAMRLYGMRTTFWVHEDWQ
ncbi:MAG: flippase activity-associated protein Agl23 [Haloarculaceae archaeon]